jgi:hypothetical protein
MGSHDCWRVLQSSKLATLSFVGMVPNFDQFLISTPIGHETKDFEDQTRIRRQGGDFQDNFKTGSFCRSYMEHKFTTSLQ